MTKNTLLAATALTAMVFAGAASASEISLVTIGAQANQPVVVGNAAALRYYYLASNAVQPATATNFTSTGFAITQVAGTAAAPTLLGEGSYDFTFILGGTGTPTFAQAVQVADVARAGGAGACVVTPSIINGGGAGQGFVTIRAAFGAGCVNADRGNGIILSRNIAITSAGTVTVSGTVANVGTAGAATAGGTTGLGAGTPPVNGTQTSAAKTVVQTATPYTVAVAADTANTTALSLTSTPVYSALSTAAGFDAIIGTATFNTATVPADSASGAIYSGLADNGLPTVEASIALTASGGDFTRLNATIGGTTTTDVAAVAPATTVTTTQVTAQGLAAARNVVLVADAGTPAVQIASSPINFSATVTPSYPAALAAAGRTLTLPAAVTGSLQTLTLEGTNFVAPWIAMQASSQSLFRLSNQGTSATGPITLILRAPNGGTVNTQCTLTTPMLSAGSLVGGGIGANTFIAFTGKSLADNCFGTTSTNADVQITIQGQATQLTAKVRTINPSGDTSEQSLGRLLDGNSNTITF